MSLSLAKVSRHYAARRMMCLLLSLLLGPLPALAQEDVIEEPQGLISLGDALSLALRQNPDLKVFSWDIRAAEARAIQAALRPNPEIGLEIEDIGIGSSSSDGTTRSLRLSPAEGLGIGTSQEGESSGNSLLGESEITLSLSQLIELGGKRAKRIAAADKEREVAVWDFEVARAEVLANTAAAFFRVLAAQERLRLADDLVALANRAHQTVQTLVEAGEVSGIEELRSQVELSELLIEQDAARAELRASQIELAGMWGSTQVTFSGVAGSLPEAFAPPAPEDLRSLIERSPYLSRWVAELELRDALITLEKANARPDLTVALGLRTTSISGSSLGSREFSTTDGISISRGGTGSEREYGLVLGFEMPIPIFNRNQGTIREAEVLMERTAEQQRASRTSILSGLLAAYERASALFSAIQTSRASVIPTAQEAADAMQEGYRQGKFGLLDVLIAQRTLFDAQRRIVENQAAFQQTVVEIERFTGVPLAPSETEVSISVEEGK